MASAQTTGNYYNYRWEPCKPVVIVNFSVSEEGNIEDVYVSTSLHPVFDAIAEKVIKRSPKWIPALSKNRHIRSYMKQPVTFGQQE
ncbi:hypothetical protein A8C56_07215 [Niabella ginsenosidivorans]|uniref:TonB C-terminal domain-containing protein n=2 Tax=Niabella ginsenosidivorans TaxID=1176587 RepID=A0A1A9HZG2_9BACT|nr:hypothetical protein A8C56_07215 [Niabella ginsenosidivorans]